MLYASTCFNLRFRIPDGAKKAGDYAGDITLDFTSHEAGSVAALHMYQHEVFSDTRTLTDSVTYGPSRLQMNEKTGDVEDEEE
jgi:hypothetical protein